MEQIEIKPEELLELINQEFPKEFVICAQKLHIKKLEEKLQVATQFQDVVKE